jgi:hypothetical protein
MWCLSDDIALLLYVSGSGVTLIENYYVFGPEIDLALDGD